MSQPLLSVNGLMMRFGGLLAVNNVNLELYPQEIVSLIGPNGAGKTTVFNCLTGFYKPTGGTILLRDQHLEGLPGQQIARMGVVRTFQHVRLFREMTVIENLLVAQHQQLKTGLFSGLLKTPSFRRAQSEALDKSFLDSLAFATTEMRLLTDNFLASGDGTPFRTAFAPLVQADSAALASRWYQSDYETLYGRLTSAIKSYMTSTQSSLVPRAEQMKKNAYRAVTPVLISLAVMIAIVLMLYYFMSVYCVNPIVRMNKSLGDYLAFRTPFAAKAEFKDEVLGLREKIEALIALVKQSGKTQ